MAKISAKNYKIPTEVTLVMDKLQENNYEAYLVGGCVRDILREKDPKDWDITTNARPEQIIELFPHTFYENDFGTVGVVNDETKDERLKVVEVTTYRKEGEYKDKRRPEEVEFVKTVEEDLSRRDFTMNAIGLNLPIGIKDISKGHFVDPYGGLIDIEKKQIKCVLNATERFNEDALRIIRAVRFVGELGFTLNKETEEAIKTTKTGLEKISEERIRDEFEKILMSQNPSVSLETSNKLGILKYISPELVSGTGVSQTKTHKYDVFEHSIKTLQAAADKDFSLEVRLAALFHDIGKPKTKRDSKEKGKPTFYGHDVVGERVTRKTLERLKFPRKTIDTVSKLVRWHMFFSDTEEITLSAVRRLIANVGQENVKDLINLRICDRIGTGRPKEEPYRLRKYQSMVEEVLRDPVSVSQLKINGKDIMDKFHVKPGPRIGWILHALLEEVLEDPKLNEKNVLEDRVEQLLKLGDQELKSLGKKGEETKKTEEEKMIRKIRSKYYVE